VHIYADEAKKGITRYVEATHYCAHVRKGIPPTDRLFGGLMLKGSCGSNADWVK